jgi:hypothetical protein
VDGLDDLSFVDAFEVDRGDPEVAVAELALDDDQWHAFVGHLDGVGVAKLVRREASVNARARRPAAQLGTRGGGRPWSSTGRAVDDAEQWADRELEAQIDPPLQMLPRPLFHSDLATAAALAAAHEQCAATVVEVGLAEGERLMDPESRSPQHYDQAAEPAAMAPVTGRAHDRDDLLDGRRSADLRGSGVPCCVAGGRRGIPPSSPAIGDDRRRRAAARS